MLRLRSARTGIAVVGPERSAQRIVEGPLALALSLLLAACSAEPAPVTLDGSTPDRFAATAAEAREQLGPADRLAFDQALASVGSRRNAADPDRLRRTTFDGMTGSQVANDFRQRSGSL